MSEVNTDEKPALADHPLPSPGPYYILVSRDAAGEFVLRGPQCSDAPFLPYMACQENAVRLARLDPTACIYRLWDSDRAVTARDGWPTELRLPESWRKLIDRAFNRGGRWLLPPELPTQDWEDSKAKPKR